jgi:hypothetical protein
VARKGQQEGRVLGGVEGGLRGQEAQEGGLLALALLHPDAWGPSLVPWPSAHQLPQSWGGSALHYQRSCLPQAYGQQTPQPRASQEMSRPQHWSSPFFPWNTGLSAQGPCHGPLLWMQKFYTLLRLGSVSLLH